MTKQTTIAIIKPDGMERGLQDSICSIIKQNGFEILAHKTLVPTREMIYAHTAYDDNYTDVLGDKILFLCEKKRIVQNNTFLAGKSPPEIGVIFRECVVDYLSMGTVMALLIQKENAVPALKQLCGATMPEEADIKSIRGRFAADTFEACIAQQRALANIIHAADSQQEANHQIDVWFPYYKHF